MSSSKLRYLLIMYTPGVVSRLFSKNHSKVMIECIRRLNVQGGTPVTVAETEMRMITLKNGTKLIGHIAVPIERKVIGKTAQELGLDPSYSKILIDAVTRYTYPHMGGAVLSMDFPVKNRHMFHPQQKNFLLEEARIPETKRKEISTHFTPQADWHCLDVGAFLGHGGTWLREQIDGTGKIICVEANPDNKAVIVEQMQRNNFKNVIAKFGAIWHTAGKTIRFNLTKRQGNAIDNGVVNGTSKIDVPTVSIKSLTEELGRPADFLSLTVNGAEVEALEGIRNMKKENFPKRIIAPAWYPKDGKSRFELIEPLYKELGYKYVVTKELLTYAWL